MKPISNLVTNSKPVNVEFMSDAECEWLAKNIPQFDEQIESNIDTFWRGYNLGWTNGCGYFEAHHLYFSAYYFGGAW